MAETNRPSEMPAEGTQRAIRILAKSVYRELCSNGHSRSEIVAFTTELLDLVTTELKQKAPAVEHNVAAP